MENKKYRVELYITPRINSKNEEEENFLNKIDLNIEEEYQETDEKENSITNSDCDETKKINAFFEEQQHIYDEPFIGNITSKLNPKLDQSSRYSQRYLPRPPKRSSSLKCIDESAEILEQSLHDICCHGNKNGCTVAVQQPEQVSRDIFKENWLQKLDALRQRESLLRDKEVALQSQERLLFKKERQLRILDRLVRDKMRQAELYLKRCKQQQLGSNNDERSSESGISHSSKSDGKRRDAEFHIYDEINMINPPNSTSSVVTGANHGAMRSARFHSLRVKQKPKIAYDDLDSTLSADVGDSSFGGVTATKFNPNMFKKPVAFRKTITEKKPRNKEPTGHGFEETKILNKFSQNIMVSQNASTKFQNYGLIDTSRPKSANDADSAKEKRPERPISWNAENDDWLQKKRQQYNMSIRRLPVSNNKENQQRGQENLEKNVVKPKKEGKMRKFMIFR